MALTVKTKLVLSSEGNELSPQTLQAEHTDADEVLLAVAEDGETMSLYLTALGAATLGSQLLILAEAAAKGKPK